MADQLGQYRRKRAGGATAEPAGAGPRRRRGAPRFVVQEHDATRLHWDLRLEHDGVLVSWALPRFIPGAPGDNRLAVRTEDHPVEYLAFSGEIPAGEYGGGVVGIFDSGTYEPLVWEPRKIEVELHGDRLTGRWALFPLRRAGEEGPEWMIHRMGAPLDPEAEPPPPAPAPMLARAAATLPVGDEWAFEVKWDGIRALCLSEPGRLSLRSRSGADITAAYPELARLGRALHEHSVLLDGEIVAFDTTRTPPRPSFQALQRRMNLSDERRAKRMAAEVPVTYVAFDLLWQDGRSLVRLPYDERRARLLGLGLDGPHWQTPEAHHGDGAGAALLAATADLEIEGVVAKRRSAAYEPGRRSGAWLKVRHRPAGAFLIGGWLEGEGRRAARIGALLLGERGEDGTLRYAGRVGSGLSDRELTVLQERLAELTRSEPPFAGGAPRGARSAHWVEPVLLADVAFTERSAAGLLRQPVWLGLQERAGAPLVLEDEQVTRGHGRTATALVGGRSLPVTNLDKVLFPGDGTTKRAVIEYAAAIAPVQLPHLRGRALTLVRAPDGPSGPTFFEKRAPGHRPEWVQAVPFEHRSQTVEQVVAGDAATLVWLAQIAALELHPAPAKASDPGRPTAVVFDLDPGAPATIVECCEVALLVRAVLEGIGLRCVPKTSGAKGLQVYVPLNHPAATFDAAKRFARTLANLLAQDRPDLVVARQAKDARSGKVLIDWLQNDAAKTTVGVYSLRVGERALVSAPLEWEEVEAAAATRDGARLQVPLPAVLRRVEASGDLFSEVAAAVQPLPAGS